MLHSRSLKRSRSKPSLGFLRRSFRPAYAVWLPIAAQYYAAPEPDYMAHTPKLRRGAPARKRLVAQIVATPPSGSLADVATKAMAAAHENAHLWSDPAAKLCLEDRATRALLESCAALTGIALPIVAGLKGARS